MNPRPAKLRGEGEEYPAAHGHLRKRERGLTDRQTDSILKAARLE